MNQEVTVTLVGGIKYVAAKTAAAEMGVPGDVVTYDVEKFAEKEGLKEGTDFRRIGRGWGLSRKTLVWLFAKTACSNFAGMERLITATDPDMPTLDISSVAEKLRIIEDSIRALRAEVEAFSKETLPVPVSSAKVMPAAPLPETKPSKTKASAAEATAIIKSKYPVYAAYRPCLEMFPLSKEEKEWYDRTTEQIAALARKYGSTYATVQNTAYAAMTRRYGVVFDQEIKEFLAAFGDDDKTKVTRIRVIAGKEMLRSIMSGVLGNIEEYLPKPKPQ